MSYLPNAQTTYFLDNSTTTNALGSIVSSPFQRSVFMPCFHNINKTHIASDSIIHILARAINDSDGNAVLGRISLSPSPYLNNSKIGTSISHKLSIVMLPNTVLTYQNQPTQIDSAILDTGDLIMVDNLNVLVISCGAIS